MQADEPQKLTLLKSRYNRLATKMNRMARMEPEQDQKKLQEGLKSLEAQINDFSK